MQTFAEQLVAARRAKGMTQEALAQAVNVARNTISSWERGRTVPDIDAVRRLSDVLDCDLTQEAEKEAMPAGDAVPTEEPPTPAGERRAKKRWMIAGAALLACAALLCAFMLLRKPAPTGGGSGFNADYYRQDVPNEAGKTFFLFDNRVWDETGDGDTFQRYDFVMLEQNGVGFEIARVEVMLEGNSGKTRSATLDADALHAAGLQTDISAYGTFSIDGGFPKGEFVRAGIAVFGTDANGVPMTFYSLIEF